MEPPAKRMRILRSVEVDETDPDYIKEKKRQNEWLKNKFDAIFAKYEAIPDMMSDELDMRGNGGQGSIVVDRGHMRKLDREYQLRLRRRAAMPADDAQLLDDMFANDPEMNRDEEDGSDYDEKDELAPSQSPEPAAPKDMMPGASGQNQQTSPIAQSIQFDLPAPNTPANTTLQAALATSANPAADLMQLVQFPQTPAGQEAQRAFVAQTAQAVQQAVTSIFSSLLSNIPNMQPQPLNLLQASATPALDYTAITPATVPSLYRQLQSASANPPAMIQSSPINFVQDKSRKRRSFATGVHVKSVRQHRTQEEDHFPEEHATTRDASKSEGASRSLANDLTADVDEIKTNHIPERRRRNTRFNFSNEDDEYILTSRILHKRSWREVINSQAKWTHWPKYAFNNHWINHLKRKAAAFKNINANAAQARPNDHEFTASNDQAEGHDAQIPSSPTDHRHLPTPSSLEHGERSFCENQAEPEGLVDVLASGGHFDNDERDLLSLDGDEVTMTDTQASSVPDTQEDSVDSSQEIPETPPDTVIEGVVTQQGIADKEISAQHQPSADVIASSVRLENTHTPTDRTPLKSKPTKAPTSSVSSRNRRQKPKLPTYHATSDSEDDLNLVPSSSPAVPTLTAHQCPLCRQTFSTGAILAAHRKEPHPTEIRVRPRSPTAYQEEEDELAPDTPAIKRESIEPPTNFLLSSPAVVKTPISAAKHANSSSGKMSRTVYNRVKQAWAKGGGRGTSVGKRRSLQFTPRKRGCDDGFGESEDELAV